MDKIRFVLPDLKKWDKEVQRVARLLLQLSRKAYKMALKYRSSLSLLDIQWKSERDLVSEADKAIEMMIREKVNRFFPEHGFIGEEFSPKKGDQTCDWIIDPIDGTTSFVRGQIHFCTSIAWRRNGEIVVAGITAPCLGCFYFALQGGGAFKNGKKIEVSKREKMGHSLFSTGFACLRNGQKENNLFYFPRFAQQYMATRRYGSAALDCCYVAEGLVETFYEMGLSLYDVAAGVLIAKEAGGKVSDFSGTMDAFPSEIIVSNPPLYKQALLLLKKE